MHAKTTRPLTASERIRLARKIDANRRADIESSRRAARTGFALGRNLQDWQGLR